MSVESEQTFQVPGTVRIGGGSRREAGELLRGLGARRVLVVTDPGVIALGLHAEVVAALEAAGIPHAIFDGVQPDPTDANVRDGVAAARAHEADALLAVGGGSAMDCGKALAVAMRHELDLPGWLGVGKVPGPGLPLVAVPTTAGTGSEVTKVAVITDTERGVKTMMLSPHLLPAAAIVDYELSLGMPQPLTAAVGVDTLTHGIEAYVSRKAGPLTDPIARSCIELCGRYLERAWNDGDDHAARAAMMTAACQGGMAFANSSVALVHGMSRPIGAVYHLPHGLSNALLLPTVTAWSLPGAPERYATVARTLGVTASGDDERCGHELVEWLQALNQRLGIPSLGAARGEGAAELDAVVAKMAADAIASGSPANNPRVPEAAEVEELYQRAW